MNLVDDGTDEEYYKQINQIILGVNVMNMYWINLEGKYGAIGADNSSCHDYFIIKFYSSP